MAKIWRACPYLGIRFWPFYANLQIWVKFFKEPLETIIYQLVMRSQSCDAYFLATFGGKMGVATTFAPNGLGPPNPTIKLADWMKLLGQLLHQLQ